MADTPGGAGPGDAYTTVQFSIEKIYVKDLSLENPGAPQSFQLTEAPQIEIGLRTRGEQIEQRDLRMRADADGHRAQRRQDGVPGRGVAGRRVRHPRRHARAGAAGARRCTARRCCSRMRARRSPTRRCARASRRCTSRRSTSRRSTSSSSRRPPQARRPSRTDAQRDAARAPPAPRARWCAGGVRRAGARRRFPRDRRRRRPCSTTRRRRRRARCSCTAATCRSRCSSASKAGPRCATPAARSAGSQTKSLTDKRDRRASGRRSPTCARAPDESAPRGLPRREERAARARRDGRHADGIGDARLGEGAPSRRASGFVRIAQVFGF